LDETIVESAIRDYGNTVLRVAASVTGNKADAEDVFSDVFFGLYKHNGSFASPQHMKAWLIRVAINRAKNIKGSFWNKKRGALHDGFAAPEKNGDASDEVLAAMRRLKGAQRAVVYLHYYEGWIFKEIAAVLHMREGSVRSAAARGREALKELLEKEKERVYYVEI